MSGYIFNLDSVESLKKCIENGFYSTNIKITDKQRPFTFWRTHHEGTFADYLGMKAGDKVFFFIKRKIYGIGSLINIGAECKYLNYPDALLPKELNFHSIQPAMLLNNIENLNNRIICFFKHSPYFFNKGVDMDDVLSSNPKSFKMLRAFWKLSFIKLPDEETQALVDIILKRNEEYIYSKKNIFKFDNTYHKWLPTILSEDYEATCEDIIHSCHNGTYIKHEMAIEAAIMDYISNSNNTIFGNWDYLSHQVIASPFKAIDYMDKMDVFGYRYIQGFPTISKYLIIEIKKDAATKSAVEQIMKYVDWINQEYSYGDYSMIEAFIVASDFTEDVINYCNDICIRTFSLGIRPSITKTWNSVRLIKYSYNSSKKLIEFEEINRRGI